MANISIGQYLPFDTFIHRLDPRVKIVGVFLYIITIFFVGNFLEYLPFAVSYTHLTLPTKRIV